MTNRDPSPAYQLRRYAWTAKLPVSILTDFEEFMVYDTRVKPVLNDSSATARTLCIPYTDYRTRRDEIKSLFSPEARKTSNQATMVRTATAAVSLFTAHGRTKNRIP